MKFGLLGAMGGLGGAMSDIGQQGMKAQAQAEAEARQTATLEEREARKQAMLQKQQQERAGLLRSTMDSLPPDMDPIDRARVLNQAGFADEAKFELDAQTARDKTEAKGRELDLREKNLESQAAARQAAIEAAQARLELAQAKTGAQSKEPTFEDFQNMTEEQRAAYRAYKQAGRSDAAGFASTPVKEKMEFDSLPPEQQAWRWNQVFEAARADLSKADTNGIKYRKPGDLDAEAQRLTEAKLGPKPGAQVSNTPQTSGKILRYVPGQGLVE